MNIKKQWCKTPLGQMLAIANSTHLLGLYYHDQHHIPEAIHSIDEGTSPLFFDLQKELDLYFQGLSRNFTSILNIEGSSFQKKAWNILKTIPFGTTFSYAKQAEVLGTPKAVRAIGTANSKNPIAILIPCHRVVKKDGGLGGYAGTVARKKWLLSHEALVNNKVITH